MTSGIELSDTNVYTISIGATSERFIRSGTTYTPETPRGSTLVRAGDLYTWTWSDGTVATFDSTLVDRYNPAQANVPAGTYTDNVTVIIQY